MEKLAAVVLLAVPTWGSAVQAQIEAEPVATISFELHRNKILIPVEINGTTLELVLDSGSPPLVLTSLGQMDRLRLTETARVSVAGAGGGGALSGRLATGGRVLIGGVPVEVGQIVALPLDDSFRQDAGRPYQGIIGLDLLRQWVTELDFEAGVMRLYDPAGFEYRGPGFSLPIWIERGHPHARGLLAVGDQPAREVELVIDTGARHALAVAREAMSGLAFPRDTLRDKLGRGVSGEVEGVVGRVREFGFGRDTVRDLVATFPDPGQGVTPGADVNVGTELLRRFRVVFDYPHDRIILEPRGALAEPFGWNPSGLHFQQVGDSLVIGRIRAGSPAAVAGLEVGDVVIAIGERGPLDLAEAEARLVGEAGRQISVRVRRAGRRIERTVVLERPV